MIQSTVYYTNLLAQYKQASSSKYGIKRIGIFGSVARGEQHEGSDVDICVELAEPDVFALVHIKEELEELFGTSVDIVRMRDRMNPILRKNIDKEGIYA